MASPDVAPGLQAPSGTYEQLAAIEDRHLGNPYTKLWVAVTPQETDALDIIVRVDERRERGPHWRRSVRFKISPDQSITDYEALRYQQIYGGKREPIDPPPPLEEVLRDIRTAQRKQPKLRPRLNS